jgi:hypothetical protein
MLARMVASAALAAAAIVGAASPALAQIRTRPPIDTAAARRDSIARDSLARLGLAPSLGDTLQGRRPGDTTRVQRVIVWDPADSVMSALLERPGYAITRYQGNSVLFRATENEIRIIGKPSIVSRDSSTLVGDTIQYNDSTQIAIARGDTLILRDPTQGQEDIVAMREMRYNTRTREGITYDVTTTVESGDRWIVHSDVAAFRSDTAANGTTSFYGRRGWITSCTEARPHYHFAATEMKLITKNVMVVRPAILYIADIPVFWLPFVFQDMRSGRRSGLIAPRFGFSELVRNTPSYRRTIEEFGYYFAISDYLDAQLTMDWRSNARSTAGDPGWLKFNGKTQYRIRDRFINGMLGASYHLLRNGQTNQQYSLQHDQKFTERTSLSANLNYVTNTTVQRNTTFNPYAAMQTISSQLNFNTGRGPFKLNLGGTQRQYPGRDEISRDFPSLNLSSQPIRVGEWLTWTPTLRLSNSERLHVDQVAEFSYRYIQRPGGGLDSVAIDRNTRNSTIGFDTPLEIFGFNWRNSFNVTDVLNDFPERRLIVDVNDTSITATRVFRRTFKTSVEWQTSFNLPAFSQGRWNLTPSVQIQKIDPRGGLLVRTERTGGKFVAQGLRPAFGVSIAPTLYGFLPGIGPLGRIRHAINPTIQFSYTPRGDISDEFLAAIGATRVGYLGANQQNVVTLNLQTSFEGRMRAASDTADPTRAQKVKLLSMGLSPLSYDFERARVTGKTGLTTRDVELTVRSDLLPGLDFGLGYSLFQGDPISDTAVFKPYRERLRGTLSLGAGSPLIRGLGRLLGLDVAAPAGAGPTPSPSAPTPTPASFIAGQPIAGSINRAALQVPRGQGWTLNLTYSAQRTRPPTGTSGVVIDPAAACEQFRNDPFTFDACQRQFSGTATGGNLFNETTQGGTYFITPAQSNAQSSMSFHITNNWAAQWSTTYDFERSEFASQIFSLQREMHDWDAIFAFTRAPNGNFAFNFHIALKSQPDIKFDFDRRSYPRGYTGARR